MPRGGCTCTARASLLLPLFLLSIKQEEERVVVEEWKRGRDYSSSLRGEWKELFNFLCTGNGVRLSTSIKSKSLGKMSILIFIFSGEKRKRNSENVSLIF